MLKVNNERGTCFFQIRGRFEARVVGSEGTSDLEEGAEETLCEHCKVGWRLHRGQSRKRRRHRRRFARRLQRRQRRLSGANHRGPGISSRRKSHLRQSHGPFLSSQGQRTLLNRYFDDNVPSFECAPRTRYRNRIMWGGAGGSLCMLILFLIVAWTIIGHFLRTDFCTIRPR